MRIVSRQWMVVLSLMILGFQALATDLLEVYHEALESDPSFKKAYVNFMAESTSLPQAMAAMLPQLSADALSARTYTEVMSGRILDVNRTYHQNKVNVVASQSIFNFKLWSLLQQAQANVKAALANFNDAAQNLILRVSQAYFDVLLAQDNLNTVKVQRQAYRRQLLQAQDRFNVGLDPVTTVYQAKAAYDQSSALLINAENNLIKSQQNLAKLTNKTYGGLAALKNKTIPLIQPQPLQAESWVNTSLKQNYKLYAAKYYLEAARQNIKIQFSGHLPYFTWFGNFNQTNNLVAPATSFNLDTSAPNAFFNNIFVPQMQRNANTGVSMNLPLFQGGLVVAKTQEAEYRFQDFSHQLEFIRRDLIANTQITFHTITSGIAKVKADRQSLASEKASLESIETQYQAGTKTITDVLFAQQQYFQTQLQYTSDQYSLILQLLQLKYYAGNLDVRDLEEINAWLDTRQINDLAPRSKRILQSILGQK
jgi:outer membrane protein